MGEVNIADHSAESLADAFGVPKDRWAEIVAAVEEARDDEETITGMVEFLVQNHNGSELVLALLLLGQLLEKGGWTI